MEDPARSNHSSEPRLWIKRLAVFKSSESRHDPIRDIQFYRGLNIIWGVELPDDAGTDAMHPVMLSGHSVGKTTLCRLIRYCLGESKFGNQGAMSRISHHFPSGWVGMEMVVDGNNWAVLKPIGESGNSKSGKNKSIEDLFDAEGKANQYKDFMGFLERSMLSGLQSNHPRNSDKVYLWKHLLAWLTRDQEARFQSLHDWRSSRSQSDTPSFDNPKDDPLYLIRLVLGLIQAEELELYKRYEETQKALNQCKARISELRHDPENRYKDREQQLKRFLGVPLDDPLNIDESDLTSPLLMKRNEITNRIIDIQKLIEVIDDRIAQKRIWLASYDEQQRRFREVLEATVEGLEKGPTDVTEDDDIRKFRELMGKNCTYGNTPFDQCQYVQQRISEAKIVDFQRKREDKRVEGESEKRLLIIEQQRKDHDEILRVLNNLHEKLNADLAEKNTKERELAQTREHLERIESLAKERQGALDLIEGRVLNTTLQQEINRADKLQEQIDSRQADLDKVQSSYEEKLKAIGEIYDHLIKRILSNSYSGKLKLPKGELKFLIEEKTGLSGEAVETLALALADVAAMMCANKGIGVHPGFLIHDSPREADLDWHIYNQYLREMWAITNEFGGKTKAPFQYIVTTTSRPPDNLREAIVLQIKAYPETEMLFRRLLKNPAEDQTELFEGSL